MKRTGVPLNSLRAFEAAGRHMSFTVAAEELNVTQVARTISRFRCSNADTGRSV